MSHATERAGGCLSPHTGAAQGSPSEFRGPSPLSVSFFPIENPNIPRGTEDSN
ncbi:Hypothetical predicted protein, partial [Marmota monax]